MADKNLLKVLLKRISIVNDFSHSTAGQHETHHNFAKRSLIITVSDLPLTDSLLDLIYTCLNSRDTMISQPSVRRLFRTLVGGLLEKFVVDTRFIADGLWFVFLQNCWK